MAISVQWLARFLVTNIQTDIVLLKFELRNADISIVAMHLKLLKMQFVDIQVQ